MSSNREVQPASARESQPSARLRRFSIVRVAIVLVALIFIAGAGVEVASWYGYTQTLAALQKWQSEGRAAAAVSELADVLRGWPIRTETEGGDRKQVSLQWWSLWHSYQLQVTTSTGDQIVSFTGSFEDRPVLAADHLYVLKAEVLHFPLERGYLEPVSDAFALSVAEDRDATVHPWSGHLPREIVRQALLLSARAELGLLSRDARLDELHAAGDGREPPRLAVASVVLGQKLIVAVYDQGQEPPKEVERFTVEIAASQHTLEEVAKRMEAFSRGEFRDLLTGHGYAGSPAPYEESGRIPEALHADLLTFNFLSQFKVLRALHAEARRAESPEVLRALAQGYAHLGALVEYHWGLAHKAFKARALLYAERLLHKTDNSAMALWTRAYVRAFVGLHGSAIEDLQLSRSRFPDAEVPAWVAVIDRACHFDVRGVDEAAGKDRDLRGLAAYMKLQLASSSVTSEVRVEAAVNMLSVEPGCMHAVAILGEGRQLGERAFSGMDGPPRLGAVLGEWLPELPELPDAAKVLAEPLNDGDEQPDPTVLAQLIRALREVPNDRSELSWASLASLIEESCLALAFQDLIYHVAMLGAPTDSTHAYWEPVLHSHRYAPLLAVMTLDRAQAKERALAAVPQLDKTLLDVSACTVGDYLYRIQGAGNFIHGNIEGNSDRIYRDLVYKLRSYVRNSDTVATNELMTVSPHCPAGIASAIMVDWGATESKLAEWEEDFQDSPQICAALGRRYLDSGRFSDAERVLKRKIELLPDQEGYSLLAVAYQYTNNEEAWLETKLASLDVPAFGLEHASTCREIAMYYMGRKEFETAKPYAVRAAGSFSGWGLAIAADCCEWLGDWDEAEQYHRFKSQRYQDSAMDWYKFCCRTGRGNRDTAWRFTRPVAQQWTRRAEAGYRQHAALCLLLEDQPEDAFRIYESLARETHARFYMILGALIAEEIGRPEQRDELLRMVTEQTGKEQNDYLQAVAQWIYKTLRNPQGYSLDEATLEWIVHYPVAPGDHTNQLYFIGKTLLLCGKKDSAVEYLQRAASSPSTDSFGCILAGDALTELGVELQKRRETVLDPEIIPALATWFEAKKLMADKKYDEAIDGFTTSIEMAPQLAEGFAWRGRAYLYLGRFDEAHSDLTQAIDLLPGNPNLHCSHGRLLEIMERPEEAVAAYESALKIDPQHGITLQSLACLRAACTEPAFRDPEAAVQFARRAAESGELSAYEAAGGLAIAYSAAGDFEAATRYGSECQAGAPEALKAECQKRLARYQRKEPYVRQGEWWK